MAKAKYTYDEKKKDWHTHVWDGTYNADGSKHRKYLRSTKSSADLEKKVASFNKMVQERGTTGLATITFGQYAREWFEISKATKELNTRKMYEGVINRYFHAINNMLLIDVRHSHLQQIINENIEHPKTCKNIKQTFGQIIKSAIRDRILPKTAFDDLMMDISLPKYIKPQKRALNDIERRAMFDADLDERKRAFISVLYYCGLRRGEALALTPDDFDFNNMTVSISKVIVFDNNAPMLKPYPKSDNGIRLVPLPNDSLKYIKPFVEHSNGFIFHSDGRNMMTETGYKRMWDSILVAMNVAVGYDPQRMRKSERPIRNLTAHVFRHNYCSELCYKVPEISTKMIARLMGDTENVVLGVYSHIVEEKENVSNVVNSIF